MPPSSQSGSRLRFYTVVNGDTLTSLAHRLYGAASASVALLKANPMLMDPNRVYVGKSRICRHRKPPARAERT